MSYIYNPIYLQALRLRMAGGSDRPVPLLESANRQRVVEAEAEVEAEEVEVAEVVVN